MDLRIANNWKFRLIGDIYKIDPIGGLWDLKCPEETIKIVELHGDLAYGVAVPRGELKPAD